MSELEYRSPETYQQKPLLRKNVVRILHALNKSGFWTRNLSITGLENIDKLDAPAIIAPNHRSMADPILNGVMIYNVSDRMVMFPGKADLWGNHYLGKLCEALGAFPVQRNSGGAGAAHFQEVGRYAINNDRHIVIYPEGKRYLDDAVDTDRIKHGASNVSVDTGAPIVPVGQYGTENLFNPIKRLPVTVTIGEPIYPAEALSLVNDKRTAAAELTGRLATSMQVLLDESRQRYESLM